jgi:DNA replication and repair protein RecF
VLIKSIKINNLRNVAAAEIEANPVLNFLVGDNGAGKTTVLEALIVLAKGRSFRSGQITSLLGPVADRFMVTATIQGHDGRTEHLGVERSADQWRARRNREDVKNLGDLAESLPLVLLEPNSHLLISGPPDGRRRYLDWGVFHVEHSFLSIWRRYARAVKQRNAALRSREEGMVKSLDPLLSDLGEQIHQFRLDQVEKLQERLPKLLGELAPGLDEIGLRYLKGWTGDELRLALEQAYERDFERGATGPGPHRADLGFDAGNRPARDSLSRGEMKITAAALMMAQAGSIAETGSNPVLLLDDLASEFDAGHRANVIRCGLASEAQIWVTGTALDSQLLELAPQSSVFHVEQGRVSAA